MAQIFVSHSKEDENRDFFHKVISGTSLKGIWMEFEDVAPPPWSVIKYNVVRSNCVIVSLSRPLASYDYRHTQNWIDFEVGLACAFDKHVWVLEPWREEIDFAVPYCTHYSLFESDNVDHLKYFKEKFEEYSRTSRPHTQNTFLRRCAKESCGVAFYLMSDVDEFRCPSCRTRLKHVDGLQTSASENIW